MIITYQLTENEYQQAVTLHHKKGQRVIMLAIYVVLAIIIVLAGTDFSNAREVITNILAVFFSISFYMLFVRILSSYQAKSIYKKSATLSQETTLRISGKGIQLNRKANDATIPWSAFSKWKKDAHFYLLYTTPRQFNVIPAAAMNESERKELETYLEKYIPQG